MTTKRKVRADFDKSQPITVKVSGCSVDIKEQVQQAFFDVGITWFTGGIEWEAEVVRFRYLDAEMYTNSTPSGTCHGHLMYSNMSRTDSISHQQFLDLVYEPEQQGHVHAPLMAQYAEDALTHPEPWKLWQCRPPNEWEWRECFSNLAWGEFIEYRRKPKTHLVHGVEVPDLRIKPSRGENYYYPLPTSSNLVRQTIFIHGDDGDKYILRNNLCYEYTEAGKQAAILHSKAWLGIA